MKEHTVHCCKMNIVEKVVNIPNCVNDIICNTDCATKSQIYLKEEEYNM